MKSRGPAAIASPVHEVLGSYSTGISDDSLRLYLRGGESNVPIICPPSSGKHSSSKHATFADPHPSIGENTARTPLVADI